jgi:crotonobetainyl-CoA:carnitine CoA-transferase CaiB-like acyl-CoA transferase
MIRVLEISRGTAAAYCGKLLAEAGAEVVAVEPEDGHPLRRRRPTPEASPGALFDFLFESKQLRPESDWERLVASVDAVVEDIGTDLAIPSRPGLVRLSLTPFGLDGPWRDRPASEFVIQAMAGSTGRRGLPGRPPVFAGGAPIEFAGGSYAAAAVSCFLASDAARAEGVHLDVSLLEVGAVTMHAFVTIDASFRESRQRPPRTTQIPSIEPSADGFVGFSTITAQQFVDFLHMIERPDLAADKTLIRAEERQRRREEVVGAIRAWTTQHTTEEILELATAFRVPVAPIGNGENLPKRDHMVERGVFRSGPGGAPFPRRPWQLSTLPHDGGPRRWSPGREQLPLSGLRIADFTAFWAGPSATHLLACLGADVVKVESAARPDGMRYTSSKPDDERWLEWSAVFFGVNANKRSVALDLHDDKDRSKAEALIRWGDVVIENFSPRVLDSLGLGVERIHEINPGAVVVRMPAFGLTGPWRDRTGFAMTVEQASGMAWITGYDDGPPMDVSGVCDPLGGMHAVVALMEALRKREETGETSLVEVPLVEVAINAAAEQVVQYSRDGLLLTRDSNKGPEGSPQGVYPARGDDRWVALTVRRDSEWQSLKAVVGWAAGDVLDGVEARRANHREIDARIARWSSEMDPEEAAEKLLGAGIPAAVVVVPAEVADNAQLRARQFFEVVDHPVAGRREIPSLPIRIAGRSPRWYRTAPPTVGQHTAEVERVILGQYTEV